jgi:hypothetical protein
MYLVCQAKNNTIYGNKNRLTDILKFTGVFYVTLAQSVYWQEEIFVKRLLLPNPDARR